MICYYIKSCTRQSKIRLAVTKIICRRHQISHNKWDHFWNKRMMANSIVQSIFMSSFNALPYHKILGLSKFKTFADDKINVTYKQKPFVKWEETIVGKGENAVFQHFLLFPQCFQKASFPGLLKIRIVR